MRIWLTVSLLASSAAATAQSPVVLADGRTEQAGEDFSDWLTRPPIRQATEAARTYWRGQDADYEEEVDVLGVAEGAFTTPGVAQQAVLYLMSPWPRCCPKMGLAVLDAGRLLRNVAFGHSAQALATVPDLDGDGRDELVTTGWSGMGGQESGSMTLLSLGVDGVEEWGTAAIYDGACAAGRDGTTAARITAGPGPAYTIEHFVQPSCADAAWQSDGGPEPFTFEPPGDPFYFPLPVFTEDGAWGAPATGGARQERGELRPGDATLTSGEFYDTFEVEGRAGDRLVVDLRATDFDPYLIVALPDGEQLDNDDHEGDRSHAQITTVLAREGVCRVLVTSYAAGETGAYELTIRTGNGGE